MYAMGISDGQLVQPGSLLIMELHREEEEYLVRVSTSTNRVHILSTQQSASHLLRKNVCRRLIYRLKNSAKALFGVALNECRVKRKSAV